MDIIPAHSTELFRVSWVPMPICESSKGAFLSSEATSACLVYLKEIHSRHECLKECDAVQAGHVALR